MNHTSTKPVDRLNSSGYPTRLTIEVSASMAEPALTEALFEVINNHAFSQMTERQKMHCVEHVMKSVWDRAVESAVETYQFSTGVPVDLGMEKAKEAI